MRFQIDCINLATEVVLLRKLGENEVFLMQCKKIAAIYRKIAAFIFVVELLTEFYCVGGERFLLIWNSYGVLSSQILVENKNIELKNLKIVAKNISKLAN